MHRYRCPVRPALIGASVLAGLLSLPFESAPGQSPSAAERPNFVFILVDDLGWADLGYMGADLHQTPHIDRFAGQCVRFSDAYAAAPVCSPTRAAVMTGKCPARLHMTIWYEASAHPPTGRKLVPPVTVGNLPHAEVTVAEVLHEAGYLTAHVGKWHLGDAAHYPQTQGFDVNIGGTFWGAPNTFFYPYRGTGTFGKEFRYVPHLEFGSPGEYLTDRLTDEAIGVLRKAGDRPFFLYLAYHTVHTPIEAKPDVVDRYAAQVRPGLNHQNATYSAMVHSLDENVGRVLDEMDKLGVAEQTVVFLTSDNGGFVNQFRGRTVTNNAPLRSGKGSLYEGGVRVPLLVRWPGVTPAGARCREPVISMDFYPTILEMAGLKGDAGHNATVDGLSLVPVLKNPSAELGRETLYWHYPHYYPTTTPVSSVRRGQWKLLEYLEDNRVELYDLGEDLGEEHDLAAEMPDRAEGLRTELHRWREAVDAQMPEAKAARGVRTAPVSGTVTIDGQPAAGSVVMFLPEKGGRPATGTTGPQGQYSLTTFRRGDGAPVGTHRVVIRDSDDPPRGRRRIELPKKYSDKEKSELRVEIAAEKNEVHFDLRSE